MKRVWIKAAKRGFRVAHVGPQRKGKVRSGWGRNGGERWQKIARFRFW